MSWGLYCPFCSELFLFSSRLPSRENLPFSRGIDSSGFSNVKKKERKEGRERKEKGREGNEVVWKSFGGEQGMERGGLNDALIKSFLLWQPFLSPPLCVRFLSFGRITHERDIFAWETVRINYRRECEMRDGSFSVPVCEEEWIEGVIKKTWGWLRCNSQEEINGEDKLELWAWWYLARFYSMIDDLNNERDDEISLRNSWKETRYFLV